MLTWFARSLPGLLFRDPSRAYDFGIKGQTVSRDKTEKDSPETPGFLLCAQCRRIITRCADRMEVEGSHSHAFANPAGMVFEIGCFLSAKGCKTTGPATDAFSWFKGYCWEIACCRNCRTHLGWGFVSDGMHGFFALIFDRLVESGS
jgi:hypothetical protein